MCFGFDASFSHSSLSIAKDADVDDHVCQLICTHTSLK